MPPNALVNHRIVLASRPEKAAASSAPAERRYAPTRPASTFGEERRTNPYVADGARA